MNLSAAKSLQSLVNRLVMNLEAASLYGENAPAVYEVEAKKALKSIVLNLKELAPLDGKKERKKDPEATAWRRKHATELQKLRGLSGEAQAKAKDAYKKWLAENPSPSKRVAAPVEASNKPSKGKKAR
jgi:hypothetical protein